MSSKSVTKHKGKKEKKEVTVHSAKTFRVAGTAGFLTAKGGLALGLGCWSGAAWRDAFSLPDTQVRSLKARKSEHPAGPRAAAGPQVQAIQRTIKWSQKPTEKEWDLKPTEAV